MLVSQATMFNDCKDLAHVVHRVYQANEQDGGWPEGSKKLLCNQAAESYKTSWDTLGDIIRVSTSSVCEENANDPLKENSLLLAKTIEDETKSRRLIVKDFDSYRRRLKTLQQKRDAAEAQGKGNTPAHADTLSEIQRFESKVQTAGETYTNENIKCKQDIINSKEKHDELLEDFLITIITAQVYLYS
jgi:hypothetical protein